MLEKIKSGQCKQWWVLGIVFFIVTWINVYWGILSTILGVCYGAASLIKKNNQGNLLKGIASCIPFGIFIAVIQLALMSKNIVLGSKEDFLIRASLDTFDIVNFEWNRMGLWRAINPVILICSLMGIWKKKVPKRILIIAILFLLLSIGPEPSPTIKNPIYLFLGIIPGFWRFAKPEIYFLISYGCLCVAAVQIELSKPILILISLIWLVGLYSSEAFPYLTVFIESSLSPNWYLGL